MNLNQTAIDYRDIKYDKFLSELQGNIIKGHGRDNTMHIFVKFLDEKKEEIMEWIKSFAEKKITSCKEQLRQRELFKRNGKPGALFAGIYFTKDFYIFLGKNLNGFKDHPFKVGMKSRELELNDLPVSEWEDGYKEEMHAMILIAHDEVIELGKAAHDLCMGLDCPDKPLEKIATIIDIEYGTSIRNANGDGLEHFGYVDGISQPLFLKDEVDAYKTGNVKKLQFDPAAPLDLVLVKDPYTKIADAFGSYFVFRKLEQSVRDFKKAEEDLAHILKLTDEDAERVGAMIVGRFEDGTPLTLSSTDRMISSGIMNNFNYKEKVDGTSDHQGARCPFHGHIRKSNPRDEEAKKHIMARRGITYGHRNVSTTIEQTFVQMPKSGVGLLFMSFQKSIANQFEYIQKSVNDINFPITDAGMDCIIGQGTDRRGHYPVVYNDASDIKTESFKNFVTLKGGEYFFAPSMSFLKNIK